MSQSEDLPKPKHNCSRKSHSHLEEKLDEDVARSVGCRQLNNVFLHKLFLNLLSAQQQKAN